MREPLPTNPANLHHKGQDQRTILEISNLEQEFRDLEIRIGDLETRVSRGNTIKEIGSITISDTNTSGVFNLAVAEADVNYGVSVYATGSSGSPAANSLRISQVTKAVGSVTVAITTAPGAGDSRTFEVVVFR